MKAYLAGKLSTTDAEKLKDLLESDNAFQEMYSSLVKFHASSSIPKFESVKQTNFKALANKIGLSKKKSIFLKFRQKWWRIAAAIFIGVSIATTFLYLKRAPPYNQANTFSKVSVPAGGKKKLVLPDQTVVWLNATSTLKYRSDFNEDVREVYLDGEGFFDVERDESRPFVVHTKQLTINVLGTEFNVNAYAGDHEVAVNLLSGSVDIAIPDKESVSLLPNQQLVYQKADRQWIKEEVEASRSVWWTTGKLYFNKASLREIMKTLERRFAVEIIIQSNRMDDEHFSGSIDQDLTIQEVLHYLDVDRKYQWQLNGDIVTIADRSKK